ncbi:ATP-binding protein [Gallaecimonas pentaromativorans]|uniref:histidine kinase n=1 Tax=Gallaecimonas pentaromativorans TaxID=584787 RepID=A0A3N1PVU4_9GAMM|nr:ATP-binding protein [Gallaecimonas pentaromativorans]ROQ28666.1 two-component system sensor histidine kinase QseC [Gallaecimonas pentaromativorans]
MKSIRRYFAIRFVVLFLLVLVAVSIFGYSRAAHEAEELYDAELAQSARIIMGMVEKPLDTERLNAIRDALATATRHSLVAGESEHDETIFGHHYEKKLLFQVYSPEGELLFSNLNEDISLKSPGYHWLLSPSEQRWRLFTVFDDHDSYWLQTGQLAEVREEITEEAVLKPALWQAGLMTVLVIILSGVLITRGLRPVKALSAQVAKRSPDELTPLSIEDSPAEVKPLVQALNSLLEALDDTLKRERRFTDDAAHELRTPLAGAQLHLDNALNADTAEAREASLAAARSGIARLTHLVGQLLTLARLEGKNQLPKIETVHLGQLIRALLAEMYPLAQQRNQQLALDEQQDWQVQGDRALLAVMIRNLVDNALRYSPSDCEILISLEDGQLTVDDCGPGIPAQERQACLARFHRLAGSPVDGAGLGLAIVVEIARRHGLALALDDSPQGGLRASIKKARP